MIFDGVISICLTFFPKCDANVAHISMRCVQHGMRHGCDSELELGMESKRGGCDGLQFGGPGRRARRDRLPFAQTHCNFGPGSADVADVVAKCPKMRHKHAHEFCNLPQPQVQRSAFSSRTNKLPPARVAVSARKCSANK